MLICILCEAAYITLRSIVIVELLGIQKLTSAFGLCALFQGIACVVGSPLSGNSHPFPSFFRRPVLLSHAPVNYWTLPDKNIQRCSRSSGNLLCCDSLPEIGYKYSFEAFTLVKTDPVGAVS